jgi:hypothetical protein
MRTDSAHWEAEGRGQALLRSWLSPDQLAQYDVHGFFEVVGSDSGKRYRIGRGHVFNIEELDGFGVAICTWCFCPDKVAVGDTNLAQKIALETFERDALAIANRSSVPVWRRAEQRVSAMRW